ncbi:MAG: MarR family transcriptional regulator [Ruminococcaceae bacterium]|nr:MarR family transcriptional regulator [Oscillospiraceae bacterium]
MIDRYERLYALVSEISRHIHKITGAEMEKYGLGAPHALCLLSIYRSEEPLTSAQLCKRCGRDKSEISRSVSLLEKKNLILRESNGQSKYRAVLKLTEEGQKVVDCISEKARIAIKFAGKNVSDENRRIMYESLKIISEGLSLISVNGIPNQN